MEEIYLKLVKKFLDEQLSSMLVGASLMLLVLARYFKLPEKWEFLVRRLKSIDRKISLLYKISKHDNDPNDTVEDFFEYHEDEDN